MHPPCCGAAERAFDSAVGRDESLQRQQQRRLPSTVRTEQRRTGRVGMERRDIEDESTAPRY